MAMTIDAARRGYRVCEVELDLEHRATHRTLTGFAHRGRQLLDFLRVYMARRRDRACPEAPMSNNADACSAGSTGAPMGSADDQ